MDREFLLRLFVQVGECRLDWRSEFVSPRVSGSSRYIQLFHTSFGLISLWQQSQEDFSQPLVMNKLSMEKPEELLS